MKLFRDREGNVYQIPQEQLDRFRVDSTLPAGSELSGGELRRVRGGDFDGGPIGGPGYY